STPLPEIRPCRQPPYAGHEVGRGERPRFCVEWAVAVGVRGGIARSLASMLAAGAFEFLSQLGAGFLAPL
ncbi:MAG: hypothetical protein KAY24_17660, partial [Candidatus Eisenbacteria sp.]|nr:hypothetical protein [Candidatus Eisenbacteria bacterium]